MPSDVSFNLIELGHFCAYLAFSVAIVQMTAPIIARITHRPALAEISVNASMLVFLLTTIGALTIVYSFVTSNFSVRYVAENSNLQLPLFYKITALWGGHEGSLYLWTWILTLFNMLIGLHGRQRYPDRLPTILAVHACLVVGFFGLVLFLSSPFTRLFPVPVNGNDLDPLLQDPGMVIHPPMLYLGYVGFSVPYAFAMAALLTKWRSEFWIGHVRRWALIAWGFLTAGIILGAWWSYYVLGWGGYWGWDPVENASFMPWLVGTALIHSITVQERRQMLHAWNIFLIITTFALSLLGTFLVRSGILASVHAFAISPAQGTYILVFMMIVLIVSFAIFLVKGRYQQAREEWISPLSRESLFIWNNVVFTAAATCVLLGTLYPLAIEAMTSERISVGPPYFNLVMVPIFLVMLVLMGVGPLVPWRKANVSKLRARLVVPVIIGLVAGIAMRLWFGPVRWTGPVAVALVGFVATTIIASFVRAVRLRRQQQAKREGVFAAAWSTFSGNRRLYGGMVVHMGILVIALGLTGSGLFQESKLVMMAPGNIVQVAGYRLRFDGVTHFHHANYFATQGRLRLLNDGALLTPERRVFSGNQMGISRPSINSNPLRDVYAVIGTSHDGKWAVHVYVNPLVNFLWFGGLIVLCGVGLTLSYRFRTARSRVAAGAPWSPSVK
ncbi:MAG: heme lyase CcmF/NrfE family subunit [Acidiferrobacteraceae bacterium]